MIYYINNEMPKNELKAVMISRLLNQEQKAQLLAWTRLAYVAEHSVCKLYGLGAAPDSVVTRKPQESSCSDIYFTKE